MICARHRGIRKAAVVVKDSDFYRRDENSISFAVCIVSCAEFNGMCFAMHLVVLT